MGDAAGGREGTSVLITDLLITDYFPVSSEENAGFGTLSPYLRRMLSGLATPPSEVASRCLWVLLATVTVACDVRCPVRCEVSRRKGKPCCK